MDPNNFDTERLLQADAESRREIARKIGLFVSKTTDPNSMESALEFARILVEDAAVSVRKALADQLSEAGIIPLDIKRTIASDIDSISLPFIIAARSLDDEFLLDLLKEGRAGVAASVAARSSLSEAIAAVIAETSNAAAVEVLASNKGADVSETIALKVVERFPENSSIMTAMSKRGDLSIDIIEMIIFKVAHEMGEFLFEKYDLDSSYSRYLSSLAGRRTFMKMLDMAPVGNQLNYLQQLQHSQGLDAKALRMYLQAGAVNVFTAALSLLVGSTIERIQARLQGDGNKELAKLLEKAGFSKATSGVLLIEWSRLASSRKA